MLFTDYHDSLHNINISSGRKTQRERMGAPFGEQWNSGVCGGTTVHLSPDLLFWAYRV